MITDANSTLSKKVEHNILSVLQEKEAEVDDLLHDYSAVEGRLLKYRDDERLEELREARLRELKLLHGRKQECLLRGLGRLVEVFSDKEFFDACRNVDSAVVHFYRPTTKRCEYLDAHLARAADSHFTTKFIKVNVERTPFIVERFGVWCIPTLMIIKDGKTTHSIVGFDEFGGDGFDSDRFVSVLDRHGISEPTS